MIKCFCKIRFRERRRRRQRFPTCTHLRLLRSFTSFRHELQADHGAGLHQFPLRVLRGLQVVPLRIAKDLQNDERRVSWWIWLRTTLPQIFRPETQLKLPCLLPTLQVGIDDSASAATEDACFNSFWEISC